MQAVRVWEAVVWEKVRVWEGEHGGREEGKEQIRRREREGEEGGH